jgi:hypothetical protein
VPDPLLHLPAVGRRLPLLDRLELGLGRLELSLRTLVVDLRGLHRVVDEGDRPVVQHLEEPGARGELEHLRPLAGMNPRRAGAQGRDQRSVACKHADVADLPGHDDHLSLPLVGGAVGGHEGEIELLAAARHAGSYAAARALPRSTAPSIGPTM